jgi:hypothetical protein
MKFNVILYHQNKSWYAFIKGRTFKAAEKFIEKYKGKASCHIVVSIP